MKVDGSQRETVTYLDPVVPPKADGLSVPAVEYLHGKWIGFLENGWKSFSKISVRLEELLVKNHGIAGFRRYKISSSSAPPQALFDQVVAECDGAIVGLAN